MVASGGRSTRAPKFGPRARSSQSWRRGRGAGVRTRGASLHKGVPSVTARRPRFPPPVTHIVYPPACPRGGQEENASPRESRRDTPGPMPPPPPPRPCRGNRHRRSCRGGGCVDAGRNDYARRSVVHLRRLAMHGLLRLLHTELRGTAMRLQRRELALRLRLGLLRFLSWCVRGWYVHGCCDRRAHD